MLNEGNQIHNFVSSSGSTVINYGSGSDFLTSYGSGPVPQAKKLRFRFHNTAKTVVQTNINMRFHFDADLDRNFHSDADPDPAPHESDNEFATDGQQTLQGSIVTLRDSIMRMRIRILHFTLLRIRLHKTKRIHADRDQQHWSKLIKEFVLRVRVATWEERVWKTARNPGFPSFM